MWYGGLINRDGLLQKIVFYLLKKSLKKTGKKERKKEID